VVEAAVYPVPDAQAGDQVMAAVVLSTSEETPNPTAPDPTAADLAGFDAKAFAAFLGSRRDLGAKALPRYVRLCRALPQTPSHKVIKRLLAKDAWRTSDPVWWWPGARAEPRLLDREDVEAIEDEFIRNGRHHLLED
jgi:fatty-acyl-CoA synthase